MVISKIDILLFIKKKHYHFIFNTICHIRAHLYTSYTQKSSTNDEALILVSGHYNLTHLCNKINPENTPF
jgi:hypothetical protein